MKLFAKLVRWWHGEADRAERAEAERALEERDLQRSEHAFEATSTRHGGLG